MADHQGMAIGVGFFPAGGDGDSAPEDCYAALVRGPASLYPRGYPWLVPVWLAALIVLLAWGWSAAVVAPAWWYYPLGLGGLAIAAITLVAVLKTVRHLAFRADGNGVRLGIRSRRKRPRQRQVHLWWADVQQIGILPRHYGALLEITLGPSARIVRRRGLPRQALLMTGMLVLPLGLGRGAPRLTEPRGRGPQYRVPLYEVTPEEVGMALAALALPEVEITVMSHRHHPLLARRPSPVRQPAA
jgi:hypothetical protein